jgi:hypothetical protein
LFQADIGLGLAYAGEDAAGGGDACGHDSGELFSADDVKEGARAKVCEK